MFPPVNSGGLIEALGAWLSALPSLCCFRRRIPAASLKQADHRDSIYVLWRVFPPVNSGGLIEAARSDGGCALGVHTVSAGEFRRPH